MNNTFDDRMLISEIVNRILNCMKINKLYVYGDIENELDNVYIKINRQEFSLEETKKEDAIYYFQINTTDEMKKLISWYNTYKNELNSIVYLKQDCLLDVAEEKLICQKCYIKYFSTQEGVILLIGEIFNYSKVEIPDEFKVLAIMHCYNEIDIIEHTVEYLLQQQLYVYVLDNWSNDGTYEAVDSLKNKYPNQIYLQRFPENGENANYGLFERLQKTEEISKEMSYDWYIHYDADEMRVSPWQDTTLREMIYKADQQGYNLIENTVIDFKITNDTEGNIFMKDAYYDFGHKPTHFQQVKTWKKSDDIELKGTGGHMLQIPNPKIYPLKILNRHYPLRSREQAEKKIFKDRKPRLEKVYKEKGWHGHYFEYSGVSDLLSEVSELLYWNEVDMQKYFIPLFLGCGIRRICVDEKKMQIPGLVNKRIVLYGSGVIGQRFYKQFATINDIVTWVDKKYEYLPNIFGECIKAPCSIKKEKYDYIVIAVKQKEVYNSIINDLQKMGVTNEKIIWIGDY